MITAKDAKERAKNARERYIKDRIAEAIEDGYDSLIDDLLNRIEEGKAYYGNVFDYWNNKLFT